MTDSPTSQAMHLAMTELEYRRERIAELHGELAKERADAERYRWLRDNCSDLQEGDHMNPPLAQISFTRFSPGVIGCGPSIDEAIDEARSVLNKETSRG